MENKLKVKGLTEAQVTENRRRHGSNVLTPPVAKPWWREMLVKFSDPLIIILLLAGALSIGISFYEYYALDEGWKVFFEPIGIFIAILLATGLAYLFESRANKAFKILNLVNDDEPVEVVRSEGTTTVQRRDVVVGDIVMLNTGDEVPADGSLLDSVMLSVDESSLTGEPVCPKNSDPRYSDPEATYPTDRVMRGTKVMEGHGVMIVERVGDATEMGKVFEEAQIDDSVKTPLNEQLDRLGKQITRMSYTIAALIIVCRLVQYMGWGNWQSWLPVVPVALFFLCVVTMFPKWGKRRCLTAIVAFFGLFVATVAVSSYLLDSHAGAEHWSALSAYTLQTLMVAVTLIVVAVPEGLPMAVTLSLAYSMRRMLKTKNLVRKLHACETMGAATVICTDKTGTLTQNRMQVAETQFYGDIPTSVIDESIAVNSTATLDRTSDRPAALGNPTEGALLFWIESRGADYEKLRVGSPRVAEIPFTTERKYMATVVESAARGGRMLYVKGAPEIVLGLCSRVAGDVSRESISATLLGYQEQAMRTLGFACMPVDDAHLELINNEAKLPDEGLIFMGIAAISDPVRDDVPEAVAECRNAGIEIKMVTGDTPATAREIGRRIGLWTDADTDRNTVTGPEFAALSDDEVRRRVNDIKIISRARPTDKKRLVEALQALGHVVAVTGDGTNDAPALRAAHVGLSMGDGTSVAKEASDITIVDNSFSSIGRAVMWGRSLYQNIQRFLLFQLTVNVAACLLVLVGSFMGTESPLTVTQMLWINLIMDTFGAMALASLPPSPHVMNDKPRDRRASIMNRPMKREILGVGILFFALTIGFYWLFVQAEITSLADILHPRFVAPHVMTEYEATLLFSIFVWTHFWYMFDARTFETGENIWRTSMSGGFWTIVMVIVAGQLVITELFYEFFNVEPMLHTLNWHFNPTGTLDLLIIVAASSLVLWIREIYRLVKRVKNLKTLKALRSLT